MHLFKLEGMYKRDQEQEHMMILLRLEYSFIYSTGMDKGKRNDTPPQHFER